jgi:Tfp pilus assembly pilus retraction ATPase PilT
MNDLKQLEKDIVTMRKDYDADSQDIFDSWLDNLRKYAASQDLLKHQIIVDFAHSLDSDIQSMEYQLKTVKDFSPDINQDKRIRTNLFDKIELYKRFVNLFKVEDKVNQIKEEIKKYA